MYMKSIFKGHCDQCFDDCAASLAPDAFQSLNLGILLAHS